jgi:hypothetical protein
MMAKKATKKKVEVAPVKLWGLVRTEDCYGTPYKPPHEPFEYTQFGERHAREQRNRLHDPSTIVIVPGVWTPTTARKASKKARK